MDHSLSLKQGVSEGSVRNKRTPSPKNNLPPDYTESTYRIVAGYVRDVSPCDCHPALYERRYLLAEQLLAAAENPTTAASKRLLNGVRFLCYRLRR